MKAYVVIPMCNTNDEYADMTAVVFEPTALRKFVDAVEKSGEIVKEMKALAEKSPLPLYVTAKVNGWPDDEVAYVRVYHFSEFEHLWPGDDYYDELAPAVWHGQLPVPQEWDDVPSGYLEPRVDDGSVCFVFQFKHVHWECSSAEFGLQELRDAADEDKAAKECE